jgi:uncharacterized protein YicC (UPF0701 family)
MRIVTKKKKKRVGKRKRKTPSTSSPQSLPPATQEAVARLEKLAHELDNASKEAEAVAEIVRTDLTEEFTKHLVNGAAKTRS